MVTTPALESLLHLLMVHLSNQLLIFATEWCSSYVQLIKDGAVYSEVHANHKSHDQLSKTVLVQLKKGQTVWIRLYNSSSYAVHGSGRYTTFAGYLISYQ